MSLKPPVSNKDHIQGNSKAAIELVEYGDYQCPYCGQAYPIIKKIQQIFDTDLEFVFRNFPLSEIHPHARLAAIAAEAAAMQGKFWEMHDIIFENQQNLLSSYLIAYARMIGLDIDQFKTDLKNDACEAKVDADFESGIRSGVNGTPGFFINGEKYNGPWDEDSLSAFIKAKIDVVTL
jgi:protein-disulfide isomerase